MLSYRQLDTCEQIPSQFESEYLKRHTIKYIWNYRLQNGGNFVSASMCL